MATEETSPTLEENAHIVKFVVYFQLFIHSIQVDVTNSLMLTDLPQQQEWYYQVQVLTLTRTKK